MDIDPVIISLKAHEGFRSRVYKDSLGFDTIGYGFAIKDLELSEAISTVLLTEKVLNLVVRIHDRFQWFRNLPNTAQCVIVNMCYQLGITGVSKFRKMIKAMNRKDWNTAAAEMLDSRWAKQTPTRAKELSKIIKNIR